MTDEYEGIIVVAHGTAGQLRCAGQTMALEPPISTFSLNASVEFLTAVFLYSYERAGTPMLDKRIEYALYWSDYFSKGE